MTYDPYGQPSQPAAPPPPGMQPPPGMPMAPPYGPQQAGVEINGRAVAALVCGVFFCTSPLGLLPLLLGKSAQRQIEMGMGIGRPIAKAGVVLGWIGVAFTIFWILYFAVVIFAVTSVTSSYSTTY